ncbi:hypothetical protein NERG_02329 [Nematocida ausubeli]|uniref:SLC26A/SulP transporter domain-containing protein n=1 Tax=Nematocida ausubeli (strain ATCC PRA-371 / ERTm2) TaxID=1913371 RepID=H8ZFF8_NEMA1|nr:hypothetical protein NERG_02329 [Nematocida ausubeli]
MVYNAEQGKLPEYTRSFARKAKSLLYKCPVVFFGAVLYLMYVMTVGEKMFSCAGSFPGAEVHTASAILFVAASCISQVLFFALSSYTSGVISSPISESFRYMQSMHESLAAGLPLERVFTNLFVCLALSALLTSAGFFLMYILRAERMINRIPSGLSMALFISIGFLCVSYANERVCAVSSAAGMYWQAVLAFNAVGIAVTLLCKVCKKRCPAVARYSVLWAGVLLTAVFYVWALIKGETTASLIKKGWLASDPRKEVVLAVPRMALPHIDLRSVLWEIPSIGKIAAMNLMQFPINFPPAKAQTGKSAHARKELLANGVCNAVTSLFGCSVQVLPSSTIAVYESGSRHMADTLLFTAALIGSLAAGHRLLLYVPFAVFDMLFLCLGLNIVLQSGLDAFAEGWGVFAGAVCVSVVSTATGSVLCGAAIGALLYAGKYMYTQHSRVCFSPCEV